MKKHHLLLYTCLLFLMASCKKVIGSGPVVTQSRGVSSFHELELRFGAEVEYTLSATAGLQLDAQQNVLDVIESYVSGDRLVIKFRDGVRVANNSRIHIKVSSAGLYLLRINGTGTVRVGVLPTAPSLRFEVTGPGGIEVTGLSATTLSASVNGSGSLRLQSGSAASGDVDVSGSGDVYMQNVQLQSASAHISGSGNIRIQASQQLNASISGSGKIYYRGQPRITTQVSGSGKVLPY
jgi:hypothetical protein